MGAMGQKCSSAIVGMDAFVGDCRRIGKMGLMCKVGIINYLVSG
jgi:hypothetical protein